jgi:hypothetical protein
MALYSFACYPFVMQITIEISDELAAKAQARGLTPESYVRSVLDDVERGLPLPLPPSRPKMDMKTFLKKMTEFSDKIPQLPDEAFTRESFYQDHD